MQRLLIAIIIVFGSSAAIAQAPAKVSLKDFKIVFGNWEGALTYLDYSSGKPFSMPANVVIAPLAGTNHLLMTLSYPEEAEANETDTLTIAGNGTLLDGEKVVSKRKLPDGGKEIVTEIQGVDGNDDKPARMRHTYTLGRNVFAVRKDVLFDGEKDWIMRHEFRYEKRTR
jgi:hypothetical protein